MAPARRAAANRGRRIGSPRPSAPLPGRLPATFTGSRQPRETNVPVSVVGFSLSAIPGDSKEEHGSPAAPGRSGELFDPGTTPDPAMGEQPVIVRFGRLGLLGSGWSERPRYPAGVAGSRQRAGNARRRPEECLARRGGRAVRVNAHHDGRLGTCGDLLVYHSYGLCSPSVRQSWCADLDDRPAVVSGPCSAGVAPVRFAAAGICRAAASVRRYPAPGAGDPGGGRALAGAEGSSAHITA